ncbi:sigma-E factor negative regulatory protein [Rehaibacterium terrae]|jgi:sigma-E factor negative regulatory protein RseA|uniref:Sigma-E factor negative regulatory protein RseA n=1 Tax=Rehaibacterium terrae TaxID=1341696 RepID=A0A7W8DEL3_9GAMM|nr:RseA family anti-sigma factor [Rehaibacterium terrae]MBB5015780.1 sigma-E factor negative regulatory protein RseA [Rehaibacterium terrae]
MTDITDTIENDLSALLDGELPPDRARFLLRRLERDPALRATWERWQLASSCLRRSELRPMPAGFAERVAATLDGEPVPHGRRLPKLLRWVGGGAIAASVALAALLTVSPQPAPTPAEQVAAAMPGRLNAASDLTEYDLRPRFAAPAQPVAISQRGPVLATEAVVFEQGLDPELQAYLIRHQSLLRQSGLGELAPYVDVLAHPRGRAVLHRAGWTQEGGDR